jgi:type I restriction enzyme S subunit
MKKLQNNNNNLPKGWRKVKLGEYIDIIRGISYSSSDLKKSDDSIYLVNLKNVERGGGFRIDGLKEYSGNYKNEQLVNPGDIIIALTDLTPNGEIVGMPALIPFLEKPACISMDLVKIQIKKGGLDKRYLYYVLNTKEYKGWIRGFASGVNVLHLNTDGILEFETFIPEDPNEQKRIADILSAFDDKIELNNKIIKTLEEMAQEIFKEWFVRFRFPGWQKVKFVDSELGKIPEGWKATILEEIMNLRREKFKSYNEWKNEKLLDLGRFPQKSLTINEHGKGEEIKTSAFKFYKGDILFGAVRPYFHKVVIAPFDGVTNQSVFVIFPKKQEFYSYLITILFSESTINYATNMASGTKMPVLKYEDLANMNIVLPDFKILSIFNEIVDKFYKILIEKVEENQKLAALRDLLLPKLMSGEIRV